jgi:hypothetical protein
MNYFLIIYDREATKLKYPSSSNLLIKIEGKLYSGTLYCGFAKLECSLEK